MDGRAIPFLELDNQNQLQLSSQAMTLLSSMKEKKVCIFVFGGPRGSGKSYLASRFTNAEM
jgi:type II secretory ATPase GspE/PulE/Tfp pilus assembly ATPase PilB-like protein